MPSYTLVGQAIILNRQWLSLSSLVSQILCTLFWHPMSSTWAGPKGTLVLWASFISTLLLIAGQSPVSSQLWYPRLAVYQITGTNPLGITIFDVSWGASNTWAQKCSLKSQCLFSNCVVQGGLAGRESFTSTGLAISSFAFQDGKIPWTWGRAKINQPFHYSNHSVTVQVPLILISDMYTLNTICRRESMSFMKDEDAS